MRANAANCTYSQAIEKALRTLVAIKIDYTLKFFSLLLADIAVGAYGSNEAVLFRYEKTRVSNYVCQVLF